MKNWRAIAQANGLDCATADRIAEPLERLEATFRPLAGSLAPDVEPAFSFQPGEDE